MHIAILIATLNNIKKYRWKGKSDYPRILQKNIQLTQTSGKEKEKNDIIDLESQKQVIKEIDLNSTISIILLDV